MKKNKLRLLVFVAALLLCGLLYGVFKKIQEKSTLASYMAFRPKIELLNTEQVAFNTANLDQNTNTVFVFYNSGCDFCHHEAEGISEYKEQFSDTQILFVSYEPLDSIRKFAQHYQLNNPPQIQFFYDTHHFFTNQLAVSSVPFLLIYNKDQQLIKKHQGPLNASALLNLLQQHE